MWKSRDGGDGEVDERVESSGEVGRRGPGRGLD